MSTLTEKTEELYKQIAINDFTSEAGKGNIKRHLRAALEGPKLPGASLPKGACVVVFDDDQGLTVPLGWDERRPGTGALC